MGLDIKNQLHQGDLIGESYHARKPSKYQVLAVQAEG